MPRVNIEAHESWIENADKKDISLSEYGRRMIWAGHRQLGYDYDPDEVPTEMKTLKQNDDSSGEDTVKSFVLRNLSVEEGQDKDRLTELLEGEIEDAAEELAEENKAIYRPSKGGWIKINAND